MPAPDALVLKAELREDLERNAAMRRALQNFIDSTHGNVRRRTGGPAPTGTFKPDDTAETVCAKYRMHLNLAEVFYVAPTLLDLVEGAAISMPDETLLPQDLPADSGFLWIPGGLHQHDVRGQKMSTNAITWHRHGDGVDVGLWTDKHDPVDDVVKVWRENGSWPLMPRMSLADQYRITFGRSLPHQVTVGADVPPEIGNGIQFSLGEPDAVTGKAPLAWRWNGERPLEDVLADLEMTAEEFETLFDPTEGPNPVLRALLATWRLMQQTITTVEKEEAPRQMRRRLERMNAPERHVSIIGLRKRQSKGDGTSDVQWSHRWVVRGHWRRTPYRDPETGETVYRHIYINPFVKGPENAPLLVRDHVYALVR